MPASHGLEGSPGLALELASTLQDGGDEIATAAGLAAWLDRHGDLLGEVEPEVSLRVADFRDLRGSVRVLFLAAVAGDPLSHEAVGAVNEASAAVPTHVLLDVSDPWEPRAALGGGGGSRTAQILGAFARSAIGILGGPERARLRACPAPRCGRFFVATRADRVWCSNACGNRVRVARHARTGAGAD